MTEPPENKIPPACNAECQKMRAAGIPNNIYQRSVYHLASLSAEQAGLTEEQKSAMLSIINTFQSVFDQTLIARTLSQAIAIFTAPLRRRISLLEAEIEHLKEKHLEEIQHRITTIDNISEDNMSALSKAGKDTVQAIQSSNVPLTEMKTAFSKHIHDAVQSVQQGMQARTETLRLQAKESKAQACIDQLSGLPNKNGFVDHLRKTLPHAIKTQTKIILIFLDIDHFKTINHNYGEKVGDDAIRLVSNEGIKKIVDNNFDQEHSYCARFQGDTFAVIIKDNDLRNAQRIAELIRMKSRILSNQLSEKTGVHIYNTLKLSIGIAEADYRLGDVQKVILALITKANAALIKAQQNGGNRVVYDP